MKATIALLNSRIAYLNNKAGYALEPYTRNAEGQLKANVGTYLLDCAYGGHKVSQITNERGGERDVLGCGYETKKVLLDRLEKYISANHN